MEHISLTLSQQIQTISAAGLINIRQFSDLSENYVITATPGNTLFTGDILCSLAIDELVVYSDGLVVRSYVHNNKATSLRSHIDDYGMQHDMQGSWIFAEPQIS